MVRRAFSIRVKHNLKNIIRLRKKKKKKASERVFVSFLRDKRTNSDVYITTSIDVLETTTILSK